MIGAKSNIALLRIFSPWVVVSKDNILFILVLLNVDALAKLSCKIKLIGVALSKEEIGADKVNPLNSGVADLSRAWSKETSDLRVKIRFVVSALIVTLLLSVVKLPPKLTVFVPPDAPCKIISEPSLIVRFSLRIMFLDEPTAFILTELLSVVKSPPSDMLPLSVIVFDDDTALIVRSLPCVVKAALVDKLPPKVTDLPELPVLK